MYIIIKIYVLITLLLQLYTEIQGTSPCLKYFSYEIKMYGINETVGDIRIPSPSKSNRYNLRVGFYTHSLIHKNKPVARLKIAQPVENTIREAQQGKPLVYHIFFPAGQKIPRLTKIMFNDRLLCIDHNFVTTVEVETVYLLEEESISMNGLSQSSNGIKNSLFSLYLSEKNNTFFHKKNVTRRSAGYNTTDINYNECGVSSYTNHTNSLIRYGEKTMSGQWPWVAAIFAQIIEYEFLCTGSVLTHKHILTAAHCFKLSINSNETLHVNVLTVVLGLINLSKWRDVNTVTREVASFNIHPEYKNAITADSDMAIMTLKTSVEFNSAIAPICLWSTTTDLQAVINKIGYVVGWGEDENGHRYTEDQRMVRVPIVKQETCLRSHQVFYALTSERTFCGGSRDLKGPCNGDSGSGLVLYNPITGRYHLRGIVSRSLGGLVQSCNLLNYVVYVDVAKYVSWIQENISNFESRDNFNDNNDNNDKSIINDKNDKNNSNVTDDIYNANDDNESNKNIDDDNSNINDNINDKINNNANDDNSNVDDKNDNSNTNININNNTNHINNNTNFNINNNSSYNNDKNNKNNSNTEYSECGINNYKNVNLLIANGFRTLPGQWPWLVAIFIRYTYYCAGSVLTTKHVLTAATCMRWNDVMVHPTLVGVALGRFNYRRFSEEGSVNREVDSYKIHPDYTSGQTSIDSDLAIITLRMPVEFTALIRPICLLTLSDLQDIENRIGYIVGWGPDEYLRYAEEPMMIGMSIVSEETCLSSDSNYNQLTSEHTFCAGNRNGSSPCNADSGSGLILFDSDTGRYYVQGVLSRSQFNNKNCELAKFSIFVNVAAYLSWIKEQINST